jgi:hypothetical protein
MRSIAFIFIALTLTAQTNTEHVLNPYEDSEAPKVYAAVLALEHPDGALLIADTTVPFNSCLEPRHDKAVDSAISDYKKANRNVFRLNQSLNLGREYKLLSAKEIKAMEQPDPEGGFFWRFPEGTAIVHLSAVGFNASRTIAFVNVDSQCGGLCGHGQPYVLEKRDGQWQKYDESRNWKFGKLKKNKDGTFSGTMRGPVATTCGWNY